MHYLFFLGRTSPLAQAEAQRVLSTRFPDSNPRLLMPAFLLAELENDGIAWDLQALLGGTIKIARVDEQLSDLPTDQLEEKAANLLVSLAVDGKIQFGVAEIGRDTLDALYLPRIKKAIQAKGISARFVESHRQGLSASVLLHQNVDEVVFVRTKDTIFMGHTVAIQNIDDWTIRDWEKPAVDKKHGMLPPKVARTMLNIALPGNPSQSRILDPFCGTGTVVMEALMLGAEGIGSDLRIEAVGQTQKNCEWLVKRYELDAKFRAVVSDATNVTPELLGGKVNAIVAEGFLGPLTPRPGAVPNNFRGLEKLYKGAFKQWTKILEPGGTICIALPRVTVQKTTYSLGRFIDSLEGSGYNTVSGPYIYDRPDAIVSREIFVLEYRK